MIKIIVAMSKNRVIGNNNSLIWHLPDDLKRFKELTVGNAIVMGRKTYESIGKALPDRRNIIITNDINFTAEGCDIVNSIDEALLLCGNDCFIIGGGQIYKQTMHLAERIYMTLIDDDYEGDTLFPELDQSWYKSSIQECVKETKKYEFILYERFQF